MIKGKNTDIEFLRFFMTMIVAIFHFGENYAILTRLRGGYLCVDFFFILSGFFLLHHFMRDGFNGSPSDKAQHYLFHRIKQLFVPYVTSILLYVATLFFMKGADFKWLLSHLWETKWQYLFLHYLGAPFAFEFRSIWYLSALVLLSYMLYFFIAYNKELYYGILPIAVILIYTYISSKFGSLSMQSSWIGGLYGAVVRGFAGMSLGVLAYICVGKFKHIDFKHKISIINIVKMLCFLEILGVMWRYGFDQNDFAVLPALFILIILCNICPVKLHGKVEKIILYLGSISYWIYLLHLWVSFLLTQFLKGKSPIIMLTTFTVTLILITIVISKTINYITGYVIKIGSTKRQLPGGG